MAYFSYPYQLTVPAHRPSKFEKGYLLIEIYLDQNHSFTSLLSPTPLPLPLSPTERSSSVGAFAQHSKFFRALPHQSSNSMNHDQFTASITEVPGRPPCYRA